MVLSTGVQQGELVGDVVELRGRREPWVSKRRVAKHFGVSVRTVERWMALGLPAARLGVATVAAVRFQLPEVERWLRESGLLDLDGMM